MPTVTDADRKAAEELRAHLADLTGFWHMPGDLSPICLALAAHRENAEASARAPTGRPAIISIAQAKMEKQALVLRSHGPMEKRAIA